MPHPDGEPNVPGAITLQLMPSGKFRAKARMRLLDRTRQDRATGAYLPGRRVDVYATVARAEDAPRAIAKAARVLIIAEARRDAAVVANRPAVFPTVSQAAGDVLDALDGTDEVAHSSLYTYRLHVSAHLVPSALGAMPVDEVRVSDISGYLASLASGSGVATARHGRAVLRRTFRWAVDAGLRDTDPTAGARIVAPRTRKNDHLDRTRALTHQERVALAWAVARDERARQLDLRDLVLAGLAVGGRIGELCALTWSRVTFLPDGRARVLLDGTVDRQPGVGLVRTPPKTPSSVRTIPVPRRIAALLRRRALTAMLDPDSDLRGIDDPVFPNPGRWGGGVGWRDRSNTAAALRAVFDRAGYGWLSFHGLRRSAVTALADVMPIRQVADFAGHSSIRTTLENYVGRAEVVDAVSDHL